MCSMISQYYFFLLIKSRYGCGGSWYVVPLASHVFSSLQKGKELVVRVVADSPQLCFQRSIDIDICTMEDLMLIYNI